MKDLILRYAAPAEDSILGWERQSLPLGNGYMGANVFGRYDRERIQFTSNRLQNPLDLGGTTSFADMYIELGHEKVENYERGLNLNRGVAYCRYNSGGTHYEREYFTSYPDELLAVRLTADKPTLSFSLSLSISYLGKRAPEEGGKEGSVKNEKGDKWKKAMDIPENYQFLISVAVGEGDEEPEPKERNKAQFKIIK